MTLAVDIRLDRDDAPLAFAFETHGTVTGVFGPSGAGKTSLLHLVGGLLAPSAGSIRMDDDTLYDSATRTNRPARGVAAVSVMAPSALEADVLSTTLYLLGPAPGACLLADRKGTAALWFLDDGGGDPAGGAGLPASVAGAAAAAFEPAVESPGDSGVGRAERNPRAYTRARCDTEG